jgi:4'-phosphopantetheinyl transferase
VHVWLLDAPEDASAARAARCEAMLDDAERARMARYHFEADRRRYLFAHALVRTTLSRYAPGTPPDGWRFMTTKHGRPELAPDTPAPPLRFNLSHTAGLVACAVALGRDVGVDVEHVRPPRLEPRDKAGGDAWLEIANAHFAPAEIAALAAEPPAARRARFFAIWTLKEAYIKARGLGLALPLDGFAFELDARAPQIDVRFEAHMNEDAAGWHFAREAPTPTHALAVAARRAPHEALTVLVCRAPPEFP